MARVGVNSLGNGARSSLWPLMPCVSIAYASLASFGGMKAWAVVPSVKVTMHGPWRVGEFLVGKK